jgi:copper chaperone CopZ
MSTGREIGKNLKLNINMTTEEKNEVNKKIRAYNGDNSFIISLQKQLKTNKYLSKEELGKRMIKVLSDKQYEAAKSIL